METNTKLKPVDPELITHDILNIKDITLQKVILSEWKKHCFVKVMNCPERAKFIEKIGRAGEGQILPNMMEELVVLTCVDSQGLSIFTHKDIAKLSTKSGRVIEKIFNAAAQLNGLNKEAIQEIKGESSPTPSLDSPSD